MSLLVVLAVIFFVLKLVGVIGWSWWLVLLPIWGPLAVFAAGAIFFTSLFAVLAAFLAGIMKALDR